MNKFELLPNEMIIECLAYLGALDVFHSFDQLNKRFNKLIRTIRLYLNFEYVRKTIFDRFCEQLLLNPEMKQYIYSLNLSNRDACSQIEIFLHLFPLQEFSNLRSLSLTDLQRQDTILLKSILSSMPQLNCFHLISFDDQITDMLSALLLSQLRTLSLPKLTVDQIFTDHISSITKLKIDYFYCHNLTNFFKCVPKLKYLHIGKFYLYEPMSINWSITTADSVAVHLKELIIDDFQYQFVYFQKFVRHTPNLKNLKLSASIHENITDANAWEYLIKTSLPYLKNFMFKFDIYHGGQEHSNIIDMFKRFQSDFWQIEHHWPTLYVLDINSALIFTIPYCYNNYELIWYTDSSLNQSANYSNINDQVTSLQLHDNLSIHKYPYHFSNVTELSITNQPWLPDDRMFNSGNIKYIKEKINLSKLKNLNLASYQMQTSVLLQILKESPRLSEMTADTDLIRSFYDNAELCAYLSKMIKTLLLISHNGYHGMEKFFEVFSSLEKLNCGFSHMSSENSWNFWISLVNHLSQFSSISICNLTTRSIYNEKFFTQLQNEVMRRNLIYRLVPPDVDETQDVCTVLNIWIDEKTI